MGQLHLTAGATPVWLLGSFAVLSLLYVLRPAPSGRQPALIWRRAAPLRQGQALSAEVPTKRAQAERAYAALSADGAPVRRLAAGRSGWTQRQLRPCPGRPVPGPSLGRPSVQRSASRSGRRGPRGRTMTSAAFGRPRWRQSPGAALGHLWAGHPQPASRRPQVVEAASGCRRRKARAGPTCPPQRVRCNGCSPRLLGPGSHWACSPIWAEPARRLGEAGARGTVMPVDLVSVSWPPGRWHPPDPAPVRPFSCDGLLARSASSVLAPLAC